MALMVGCSEPSHIAQVSSCPKQASYRSSTSVGPIPFPPSLQASSHLYFWTTSLLLPGYIAFQVATTKVSGCGAKQLLLSDKTWRRWRTLSSRGWQCSGSSCRSWWTRPWSREMPGEPPFPTPQPHVSRFLVDKHWFKQASTYLAGESANPGPIDSRQQALVEGGRVGH